MGKKKQDGADKPETEKKDEQKHPAFILNQDGTIKSVISNYVEILKYDRGIGDILSYNILAHDVYLRKRPPWFNDSGEKLPKAGRKLTNTDIDQILNYIEDRYGLSGREKLMSAINITADNNRYHPVIEMLETLPYEGDGYIKNLLPVYLGTDPESEYNAEVMRLAMLAGVARVYEPGIKYDHMPILQGAQGLGKGIFLSGLAMNEDFYTDTAPKMNNAKNDGEILAGKWIIEFGELASMRNSEIENIKQFITTKADRYRPAYAHGIAEDFPRQCILFGSTNNKEYLKDTTGNRRFLPIICGVQPPVRPLEKHPENKKYLDRDIRKAWAEAVHLYKQLTEQGKEIVLILPESVQVEAMKKQKEALEIDPWQSIIERYLWRKVEKKRTGGSFQGIVTVNTSAREIYINAFTDTKEKDIDKRLSKRINDIVRTLPEWDYKETVQTEYGQGKGWRFQHTAEETEAYINKYKALPTAEELGDCEDVDGEDVQRANKAGIITSINAGRETKKSGKRLQRE